MVEIFQNSTNQKAYDFDSQVFTHCLRKNKMQILLYVRTIPHIFIDLINRTNQKGKCYFNLKAANKLDKFISLNGAHGSSKKTTY